LLSPDARYNADVPHPDDDVVGSGDLAKGRATLAEGGPDVDTSVDAAR
jgi:hypothetical protein